MRPKIPSSGSWFSLDLMLDFILASMDFFEVSGAHSQEGEVAASTAYTGLFSQH